MRVSGVAVGSSIGHAVGSFFGGSSSAEQDQADNTFHSQHDNSSQQNQSWGASACQEDAMSFNRCMNENQGNLQICNWYLDQLVKACHSDQVIRGANLPPRKRVRMLRIDFRWHKKGFTCAKDEVSGPGWG